MIRTERVLRQSGMQNSLMTIRRKAQPSRWPETNRFKAAII